MSGCHGHVPVCVHKTGLTACSDCIRWRDAHGPFYCDDLDNCGGPGCMDHLAPVSAPVPDGTPRP